MQALTSANLCRTGTVLALLFLGGCSWIPSSEDSIEGRRDAIRKKLEGIDRPVLISQIGAPILTQTRLQNIALVTQLHNTGGPIRASSQREKILNTMRVNSVNNPNAVLDDDTTTMVVAHVNVLPAAKKGEILDIAVDLSSHSTSTSLANGWVMESSLMEMSQLGGQVREGFERAAIRGRIVTRKQITGDDSPEAELQGIIVGGGRLLKSRQLGVSISKDFADALTMRAIVPAINNRFTHFDGTKKTGIAKPRQDSLIEIAIPPKYELDPFHFINVVTQCSFNETDQQLQARMQRLAEQLTIPNTCRQACWQLEAIGERAIPYLAAGLDHPHAEVRFYTAHSLAYLNDDRSIPILARLSKTEPAFRAMCFNGLVKVDSFLATDTLRELVHAAEPEVKYGAVVALRHRDASDPLIASQQMGQAGGLLEIPSNGPPLVAASLSQTPEVVIFGSSPIVQIPEFHYVSKRIIIARNATNGYDVTQVRPGEEDITVSCNAELRNILKAISDVGGSYGDWIQFLRESHENGFYVEPLALNPVPQTGRTYDREEATQSLNGEGLETEQQTTSNRLWYNPFTWAN